MTDPKGDRSKRPHEQADPDMFLHVTRRTERGIYVTGAKAHMTGGLNSPLDRGDADDEPGAGGPRLCRRRAGAGRCGGHHLYLRSPGCDTRAFEAGDIDKGNAKFGGQETLTVFDDVFIPWDHVLMDGEYEFAQEMVARFTAYHRASYVCKTGSG